jgi:hypothetical protein
MLGVSRPPKGKYGAEKRKIRKGTQPPPPPIDSLPKILKKILWLLVIRMREK